MPADFNLIGEISNVDVEELELAEHSYGDSWKQRGGVGAFMMLARKWDRIENQCKKEGYDVFKQATEEAIHGKHDGILDDIRDLRRYLLLVEGHVMAKATSTSEMRKNELQGTEAAEAGRAYINQ